MLLVNLNVPLNRMYSYAYLSIKFTIFAEEIYGGTVMVFDYLYRAVCSFHGTTWICSKNGMHIVYITVRFDCTVSLCSLCHHQ